MTVGPAPAAEPRDPGLSAEPVDAAGSTRPPSRLLALLPWLAISLVLLLALGLRVPFLGAKPLHSDEGVNGWFSLRLYWWNVYRYQYSDYHGPFLYYVNLLSFWLLGPTDFALRAGTALFGAAVPLLLLPARRFVGWAGVVAAGMLLASAPGLVYFSRTAIHEIYLVFFSVLWVVALARFAALPQRRWGLLAALGAFGAFANKETAVVTLGSIAAGGLLALAAGRRGDASGPDPDLFGGRTRREALRACLGESWRAWVAGSCLFFALIVLFFSSFGSYWAGVPGFFQAFVPWLDYGTSGRNQGKDFPYFWEVMQRTEAWSAWPAIAAIAWASARRHRLGLALSGWAAASFLSYSIIPYKTPWCVLQIDLPVFLLCGWLTGQGVLVLRDPGHGRWSRMTFALVAASPLAAVPALASWSWQDDTLRYDDGDLPYVYVQTQRGFYEMMQDHLGVGAADPEGDGLGPRLVNVEAKNPARWYLITRGWDHDRSSYVDDVPPAEKLAKARIVVATGRHEAEVSRLLDGAGAWHRESYPLRPGWRVEAWYRQDLWDAYQVAGGRTAFPWPIPEAREVHEPEKPERYRTWLDRLRQGR